MRFSPPSLKAPVWDSGSAAPSRKRMAAAYGLRRALPAAQPFTSVFPPKATARAETHERFQGVLASFWDDITDLIPTYDCSHRCGAILFGLWLFRGGPKKSRLSMTMS